MGNFVIILALEVISLETNLSHRWFVIVSVTSRPVNIKLKLNSFLLDVNDPSLHHNVTFLFLGNVFEVSLDLIAFFSEASIEHVSHRRF